MRKEVRVNGKLVAWVLGGGIVLAVAVHLLHGVQVRRTSPALLQQAIAAEDEGRTDLAVPFYSAYLAEQPGDQDAQVRYAQALLKLGTADARARALPVFEEVLRRQPDRQELRRRLVQTAVQLGRYRLAREHVEVLLQAHPDDGELEEQLGFCLESEHDFAGAVRHFEKAVAARPDLLDSHIHRAHLLRYQLDQPAEADQAMGRMIAANARTARAYLARGLYRKEVGALDGAAEDLARAEQLAAGTPAVLLPAAELAQVRGDLPAAREHLQKLLALEPENVFLYRSLSDVALRSGRNNEAADWLRRGLKVVPDDPGLLFALLELLLQGRQGDEAAEVIGLLAGTGTPPGWIKCLEAELTLQKGQALEAARELERLGSQGGSSPELRTRIHLALAHCHEQLGDTEAQLAAYRQATATEFQSPAASRGLAASLAAAGRLDEAVTAAGEVVTRWPAGVEGWVLLGRLLLQRQMQTPGQERDWKKVEKVVERADRVGPGRVEVGLLRAEVLLAQDKVEAARRLLEEQRDRLPDQVELWLALAAVAERQGRLVDAGRLLEEARRRLGDRVPLRLALARHWLRRGGPPAAAALGQAEQDAEKLAPEEQSTLLGGLAEMYLRAGKRDEAVRLWTRWAKDRAGDLRPRLVLFDLAAQAGQEDALPPLVGEVRTIEGEEGALWRYLEAVRLELKARRGRRDVINDARTLLAEASARRPSWSRLPLLAAHLDELEQKPAQALENYLQAIELGDRQPSVLKRATQLLAEHNPAGAVPPVLTPRQK
jgi:tetratricopeptide (TPR) repeat protein